MRSPGRRRQFLSSTPGPLWAVIPAVLASVAALCIPGAATNATAAATVLAVGALALLAGHTWGLIVVVSSHLSLVGRLWPALALHAPGQVPPGGDLGTGAIAVVLVTALPTLALAALLLPRAADIVLADQSPRTRSWCVTGGAVVLAASLVLPAFA